MIEVTPQLALIRKLAQSAPEGRPLGRTALMKLCYLLQTIYGVPLPYRFTLYTYGPFDAELLSDLGLAESLGLVRERVVPYESSYGKSYGYEIRGASAADPGPEARGFLRKHAKAIDRVITEFGGMTAAELEMVSTIVYADREVLAEGKRQTGRELAAAVRGVKPKFTIEDILARVAMLAGKGMLRSLVQQA